MRREIKYLQTSSSSELEKATRLKEVNDIEVSKNICSYLKKLHHKALVIPVSSAGVEKGSSCLKRIKTYLRASMRQGRLDCLIMLSLKSDIVINLKKVLEKFANSASRRIKLI